MRKAYCLITGTGIVVSSPDSLVKDTQIGNCRQKLQIHLKSGGAGTLTVRDQQVRLTRRPSFPGEDSSCKILRFI